MTSRNTSSVTRPTDTPTAREGGRSLPGALLVPIEWVERDPQQPRRDWRHDDGGVRLDDLVRSVREFGILQPLVVRREGDRYIVIAGGRRLVAARRAGLAEIPVIVRAGAGAQLRAIQLVENVVRQDLAPLDEARAYQELIDLEGLSPPEISQRVHVSAQHVRDRLRLLRDQILADAVERRQISVSVAREINKLPDDEAEALRRQVQEGAPLRMSTIQETRAYLAAHNISNPRRKGRSTGMWTTRPGSASMVERVAPGQPAVSGARTGGSAREATPLSPSNHQVTPHQRAVSAAWPARRQNDAAPPPRMSGAERGTLGVEPAPSPLNRAESSETEVDILARLVAAVDWATVEPLLHYGVEHGWTCAGLLQQGHAHRNT